MRSFDILQPGTVIRHEEERWVILDLAGIDAVFAKNLTTGKKDRLSAEHIIPDDAGHARVKRPDLATIARKAWETASGRLALIQPLIDKGRYQRTVEDVKKVAEAADRHYVSIYRWLDAYESSGLMSALLRRERSDKGSKKLAPAIETIITAAIHDFYLKEERPDFADLVEEVALRCSKAGHNSPHRESIRRRVAELSPQLVEEKRKGKKIADRKFTPLRGNFPAANYPLAVVQIDHTPADVMLVDEIERKPLERPSLTLAIDVFSRMIVGFAISLDPPGALSTGLCLSNAILPKEKFLKEREIDAKWPCWGKMRMVHADNAKEFRGTMLSWACLEHGITLENRPKGMPHFGGHVERGFRTFLKRMHRLRGTTFSNVKEKLDYDSEGKAVMTLSEFERWFTIYIVKHYHQRFHRGIKTTPYQRWEDGILGDDQRPGIGLPVRIPDEERLRLDFLPYVERTIQEYGVVIDHVEYYSDALRKWIHSVAPDDSKRARKFIFRRDPRDISVIWFYDPETYSYAEVPYRNATHPPVSLWEARTAERRLREKGLQAVNEQLIFEAIEEMRKIEQEAGRKTKAMRRRGQRRREHAKTTGARLAKQKPDIAPTIIAQDSLDDALIADGMFENLSVVQPFNVQAAKSNE